MDYKPWEIAALSLAMTQNLYFLIMQKNALQTSL
jgi:hypothetical protein